MIHSDGWRGYDGLVDIGFDNHFRVRHYDNEFARYESISTVLNHSGVLQKGCLAKLNDVLEHTFYLHLKETEFRFNLRRDDLYLENSDYYV